MSETILKTIRRDGFSFEALAAGYPELLLLKQVPQNNPVILPGKGQSGKQGYVKFRVVIEC